MTWAGETFMDFDDHTLQQRLVRLLRSKERYRRDGAKNLAADIGCHERTAKNILGGHWPAARHLRRIVQQFGEDAWAALFAPDIDATAARLEAEVRHLERQLEERKAALRQAKGSGPRPAQAVAPHDGLSAEQRTFDRHRP